MTGAGSLLMTGAGGKLGTLLRPVLANAGWQVRLSDMRRLRALLPNETFVRARLEKPRQMRRACEHAGALLHLGGVSNECDWEAVIAANVTGLTNCFEAARAAGIRRIVLASTMHVLGMHPRTAAVDETSAPAPDSRYGASKLFGEGVARLFADKYGLAITVLRIGHVVPTIEEGAPGEAIAETDLARLVLLALSFDTPGFRLFHAVAPHAGYPLSDDRLGSDHGFVFDNEGPDRATILARVAAHPRLNQRGRERRGGDFADRS